MNDTTAASPDLSGLGLDDIRRLARRTMPREAWEHQGAAERGATRRRNQQAFQRYLFRQRIFHDVTSPELTTELFGAPFAMPFAIAPLGSFHLANPDGNRLIAQAASRVGVPIFPSHVARVSPADWSAWSTTPLVFMAYLSQGRDDVERKVREAEALGYLAVGLTMDVLAPAKLGHRIALKPDGNPRTGRPASVKDVEWLKRFTTLPVVIKGIMHPMDAEMAVRAGADAVVVSNHGGRQLDSGQSAFEVLPEVVEAVGNQVPVLLDSGVRSGGDVVKALAFGARAVLLGRPIYWAVGAAGEAGVEHVLSLFREEVQRTLIMTGTSSVREVKPTILARAD